MKNWKKRAISILFAVTLLTGTALAATYECVSVEYPIIVNGEAMTFTDAEPMNYNGRTMLPLRAVADALGVPITWNDMDWQVEIKTIDTEALKDACVMLYVGSGGAYTSQGSGVLIDYDEILTCYHVVGEDMTRFKAFYEDGTELQCSLTDTAEKNDAAILTPSQTDVKPVTVGDSDTVAVGDTVYIISSPNQKKNTITTAEVLDNNYKTNGIRGFKISFVALGGSSGGAVFNSNGELIGIVKAGDKVSSFVMQINDVRKALAS